MTPPSGLGFYHFGPFKLDNAKRQLYKDGELIYLTQKSFQILSFLIENSARAVSKEELLQKFWDEEYVEEFNLVQHIYKIRKRLKDEDHNVTYVETVPKFGYQFVGEVKVVDGYPSFQGLTEGGSFSDNSPTVDDEHDSEKQDKDLGADLPYDNPSPLMSLTGRRSRSLIGVIVTVLILTLSAVYLYSLKFAPRTIEVSSIAILPFKQIGKSQDEKLGLGMADTLISSLSNQKEVLVRPTSAIYGFADSDDIDPVEIGKSLAVEAVLIGTIQQDDKLVRVNVQMIDIKNGAPIWSEKYDEKFSDIFTLQDEVANQIAARLSLTLAKDHSGSIENGRTSNAEAYKAYSIGLFHWSKRTKEGLRKALTCFQNAIEIDPEFGHALALLADTYSLIGYHQFDLMPKEEAILKAKEIAQKTLKLNPMSAEATSTLALVSIYEKDEDKARVLLRKAIKMKPNHTTAYVRLGWLNAKQGNLEKAVEHLRMAQKFDPQSLQVNQNLGYFLLSDNKLDEALIVFERVKTEIRPASVANVLIAKIYEKKKQYKKAIDELDRLIEMSPNYPEAHVTRSRVYAKIGKIDLSRESLNYILAKIKSGEFDKDNEDLQYGIALVYINLGSTEKALKILEKLHTKPEYEWLLKRDQNLDPIRNHPEFKKLTY